MTNWIDPPIFTHGQVLSATYHLNTLSTIAQILFDELHGVNTPFIGAKNYWTGWVRHEQNTLWYILEVEGSATVRVAENVVLSLSAGSYSNSVDLTALNLIVGQFYMVDVTGENFSVVGLYETLIEVPPSSFSAFIDEIVPSAENWNEISTSLTKLRYRCIRKHPGFVLEKLGHTPFIGTIVHQNRYLYAEVHLLNPQTRENGNEERYCSATFYVDGVMVAFVRIGDCGGGGVGPPPWYTECRQRYGGASESFRFSIDLDHASWPGLGLTLDRGSPYTIMMGIDGHSGGPDVRLFALEERPESTPTLATWHAMPVWGHGQYVRGNSGEENISLITTNVLALQNSSMHFNPCIRNWVRGSDYLYFTRHHRWLHYTQETVDHEPLLFYTFTAEVGQQMVTLPKAWHGEWKDDNGKWIGGSQVWKVYDLDSAQNLFPGVSYMTSQVMAAVEDTSA